MDSHTIGLFDAHGSSAPALIVYDEDDDTEDAAPAPAAAATPRPAVRNTRLSGDRPLARGWRARAERNVDLLRLAREIEDAGREATEDERLALLCFTGFGASELAQNAFPLPGLTDFREGWEEIGSALRTATERAEYAALQRATQYAHYTPEAVGRAMWRAALHLGFRGGRVLEPGCGTGLLLALAPEEVADACRFTGVEACPVTARIARLVHPAATIRCEDYTRSRLGGGFDLVLGNPPFSRRIVRPEPGSPHPPLALHDHFIAASVRRLRPGGVAILVTSTGTLDKPDPTAREHIATMADLLAAVRLPAGAFRATAGTEVVVDVLVLRRRLADETPGDTNWLRTAPVALSAADSEDGAPETWEVNAWLAAHPEAVLGRHALARGVYGPGLAYTLAGDLADLETRLTAALVSALPAGILPPSAPAAPEPDEPPLAVGTAADGATVREGSYVIHGGELRQVVGGVPVIVPVREGRGGEGITTRDAEVIRALIPIRDALRETLRDQAADRPWTASHARLRTAYQGFLRRHGPINRAEVTYLTDRETGEVREIHRRPNLAPFADDPDAWLVASIEDCDPDTNQASPGPALRGRVVCPPTEPVVAAPSDALALCLSETGRVDLARIAELLDLPEDEAPAALAGLIFRNPATEAWETADSYLSGDVRAKLLSAREAAALDPTYEANTAALTAVQPPDLRPSEISARLGAPWIPADVVERFSAERLEVEARVIHSEAFASWTVRGAFAGTAAGTSAWGTPRRHAGDLLHDALNGAIPQIYDVFMEDGRERRVLNAEATEAAKEKLARMKEAFEAWVWTDPDRADRLARIYNDRYNNLRVRTFDGAHLRLPGMSSAVTLRPHQKRAVWRIVAAGSAYLAHSVGAGKTMAIAAAVMEQRRLGLVRKAMVVVPGHTLAQWSREWLQLYPSARILVADETNFSKDKRSRFLARAATGEWDAIIITHSAFKLVAVPADFERGMIGEELSRLEHAAAGVDEDDRTTRKRIEMRKERLEDRLEALRARRDDTVTLAELGVDQILVDEAQEFRKLAFATNKSSLKGVDPDGSARAWDLYVKARFVEQRNPGRALVQASGTPIVNTLGEMYTLVRFQAEALLRERGLHEFDAWAAAFGDTTTELELQPSGAYKPVTRFARFVNVPELVDLFRTVADVVTKADLRAFLNLPAIAGGSRQLVTAEPSEAFRAHQRELARRIELIEQRSGRPKPGDDILLAVITDGRHAAIDLRLVWSEHPDEPDNKLNRLVRNVHRIWAETRDRRYLGPDGMPMPIPGATQMVFSDLGTEAVAAKRGFSAYAWIRDELIRLGVPASEIAFAQDYRKAADKARLQADMRAGRVRIAIGSSEVMGTGVNVQNRLVALHHLDVPWIPSLIEQREGRIERQGNQNPEIQIWAYATTGSMDATMWGTNERKARFIAAALSGDRSIRVLDDVGDQASQFAMAKAIASGDSRLMEKAGLEAEIARLRRQQMAHLDDQMDVRRRIANARGDIAWADERLAGLRVDLARRLDTRGELFRMEVHGRSFVERRPAGESLLSRLRIAERDAPPGDWEAGRLGGFALRGRVRANPIGRGRAAVLHILRTGWEQEVDLEPGLTGTGLIARLEHLLGRMDEEVSELLRRRATAEARLPGYEARLGEAWPLEPELQAKLARLAALDAELTGTSPGPAPAATLERAAA